MNDSHAQYFIIPLVIYPFDVMISINESDDVLLKILKHYGNSDDDCSELWHMNTARGRCVMLPSNQTVIRLVKQPKRYDMADVISHEVFHAVTFILNKIGMKMELLVSCEAYAYLTGYLTKEIHRKLKM